MQILFNNKQMDMLLENPTTKEKYIKYHLSTLNGQKIYEYIDDLYHLENTNTQ